MSKTVYIICIGPRWGYPKKVEGSLFVSEVGIHQHPIEGVPAAFFKTSKGRAEAIEFPTEEAARGYAFAFPKRVFAAEPYPRKKDKVRVA